MRDLPELNDPDNVLYLMRTRELRLVWDGDAERWSLANKDDEDEAVVGPEAAEELIARKEVQDPR